MSASPAKQSASGFDKLYVISTTLAAQAGKALVSCRKLLETYPEIRELALATNEPHSEQLAGVHASGALKVVDENALYPVAAWSRKFGRIAHLSPGRSLWYYQQVLKLAYLFRVAARFAGREDAGRIGLLIWDADTLILRPIQLAGRSDRRSISYYTKNPRMQHPPFFAVNSRLTRTPPESRQEYSNIVQFAALSVEETVQFAKFLGLDVLDANTPDLLADKIVAAILETNLINASLFSEYELIGLFHKLHIKGKFRRTRFVRVNKRVPNGAQERLMRAAGIDHFTSEEWYGEYSPLNYFFLIALIAEQVWPIVGRLRPLVTGRH